MQKQEGNIIYAGNPLTLSQGGAQVQAVLSLPQAGPSPSTSNNSLAATSQDNCHNYQWVDVAGNTEDQEGGPGETAVPCSSTVYSLDNVLRDAGDQGLRLQCTMEVPRLQPQLGPHTQPRPSMGITPTRGKQLR